MFESRIRAIKALSDAKPTMSLKEIADFVDGCMELGAYDYRTKEEVHVKLELIRKLNSEG